MEGGCVNYKVKEMKQLGMAIESANICHYTQTGSAEEDQKIVFWKELSALDLAC